MMNISDIGTIITYGALGAIGLGYLMGKYQEGKNTRKKDDVSTKRDVFELLQGQVDELSAMVDKHKTEILILQTQVDEKDKKVKEYMEILQNRNPQMESFIKYLTDTANSGNAYMKDTSLIFAEVKATLIRVNEVMNSIDVHLAKER